MQRKLQSGGSARQKRDARSLKPPSMSRPPGPTQKTAHGSPRFSETATSTRQGKSAGLSVVSIVIRFLLASFLHAISCACMQEIFSSRVDTYIRTQKRHKVTIDEGWYSKDEMTTELKWNKRLVNQYIYIYK